MLTPFLESSSRWILAETVLQAAQRLCSFLDRSSLDANLHGRLSNAEESRYQTNGVQYLDLGKLSQFEGTIAYIIAIKSLVLN